MALAHSLTVRLLGIIALALLETGFAQQPDDSVASRARERSNITAPFVPNFQQDISSVSSFAPASPADSDIGAQVILTEDKQYDPFTIYSDVSFYWTSNAPLLEDSHQSDTFLTMGLGVDYLPHLAGNLYADFGAQQRIYRYARDPGLDFNALTLEAGLLYVIRQWRDIGVYLNYGYDLYTKRGFNREISDNHSLNFGVRKTLVLTRAHTLYGGLGAQFGLGGWPDYALNHEFFAITGYQLGLTRFVKLDTFYRFAVQPYRQGNRLDLNQLIGGGITLGFTRWFSVQANSTIAINSSNTDPYSYFVANLGGGVAILISF